MNQPISAAGMAWFRRESFGRLRAMFEDGHKLHRTYDEWLAAAEKAREGLQVKGVRVVRAYLDEHDFPAWCHAQGLKLNAHSRERYASWIAYQVVTGARTEDA